MRTIPVALSYEEYLAAAANLERWLLAQPHVPADIVAAVRNGVFCIERDDLPGLACLTVYIQRAPGAPPQPEIVTGLLDLSYDYQAHGEIWPWSWRL